MKRDTKRKKIKWIVSSGGGQPGQNLIYTLTENQKEDVRENTMRIGRGRQESKHDWRQGEENSRSWTTCANMLGRRFFSGGIEGRRRGKSC